MLVKPHSLSANVGTVQVLQQNEFFQLILVKSRRSLLSLGLFASKETYYIALLVSRLDVTTGHYFVVAQSEHLKDVEADWSQIMKNVYTKLSLLADRRDEQLQFLEQKFTLEAQHTEEQVARNEHILEFHALFPTIPSESCIMGAFVFPIRSPWLNGTRRLLRSCVDYPTVMWKGAQISKGRIYLTSHFICFAPDKGPERLCLPLAHIVSVAREGLISFANPLKICMLDGRTVRQPSFRFLFLSPLPKIQLAMVVRADEIYDVLQELWHMALDEVVLKEEQSMRSMELVRSR